MHLALLGQITPDAAAAWSQVPLAGLLIAALIAIVTSFIRGWVVSRGTYQDKAQECNNWQARAEAAEAKYAALLISNIEEWKERDRTIDTLARMASRGKVE